MNISDLKQHNKELIGGQAYIFDFVLFNNDDQSLPLHFSAVKSLDLYDEDFYNEGYDNWGELAFFIDNNDTWIKTYINYSYEYNVKEKFFSKK